MRNYKTHYISGAFSVYGCILDFLNLDCPTSYSINVTSAYYGQYFTTCVEDCCEPDIQDCVELMETNAPLDWAALKATCDGQQTCSFQNPGRSVPSCDDPYMSDYLLVYFYCLPGYHCFAKYTFLLNKFQISEYMQIHLNWSKLLEVMTISIIIIHKNVEYQ